MKKRKYFLLLYAFIVFIFLVTSIFFSNSLIKHRNVDNYKVISLFSSIQDGLFATILDAEKLRDLPEENEWETVEESIKVVISQSGELKNRLSRLNFTINENFHNNLKEHLRDFQESVAELSPLTKFSDSEQADENFSTDEYYHLLNQLQSVNYTLSELKTHYIEHYQRDQEELNNLDNIRIVVTILLILSLFIWLFIFMKRNDKYQSSLTEFNERYRTYFSETHEGIFRIDFKEPIDLGLPIEVQAEKYYEHGFVSECNEAFSKMYGINNPDEIIGKEIIEFHGFDNFKKNFNAVIEFAENNFRVENQITIENDSYGNTHYFSNNAFGIIENGKLLRVWGTQREVTSEMLEANEKRILLRAVEQSQVSIMITDLNGRIEYVNPKFEEVTGYKTEEVMGKNPRFLKSGLDYETTYRNLWDTISTGKTWTGTLHNKKKNGDLFFESASISPITDESGRIKHFLAVKEDITELTEAQHELNNYKDYLEDLVEKRTMQLENRTNFLRTLIDTIPNPVFVKDRTGKYTDVNTAFTNFFGVSFDDVIGKKVSDFALPPVAEMAVEVDENLIEEYGTKSYESFAINKDGEKIPIRIFKASFGRKGEKVEGIAGLMIDISETKKTEEQMKKALEQEKELNEMKTNFISVASHELRTPLTAIYSSTELLEMFGRKWDEEKYFEHISRIKYSVDNLTNLMEDLLTLSRVDTGKIKFDPASLNLRAFVENAVRNLEGLQLESHTLNLNIDLSSEHFILDKRLINYIVQNLLSNAFKYSPEGGEVKLNIYNDNKNIYIKIRDEGIGIAESELDRLFEPFHRAKNAAHFTGTGLGLSIVKEAVDLHQGKIEVNSVENEWTEFEIQLPIID